MPRGVKAIHRLLDRDEEAGKAQILTTVLQTGGNLRRAAFLIGVSRYGLYLLLYRHELWPEVNRIRKDDSRRRNGK